MNANEVYSEIIKENDDEIFYRHLYKFSRSPKEISGGDFAGSDFGGGKILPHRFDQSYFDTKVHKNVYLSKHNRCTPPFMHDHDFYEMVYVLEGECENRIFGGTDTLHAGDLVLISPSVKHSIWTVDGLVINILIRRRAISEMLSGILNQVGVISDFFTGSIYIRDIATCLIFRTGKDESIRSEILEMLGEQMCSDEYSEGIIGGTLTAFFGRLVRGYKDSAEYHESVREKTEKAAQIMRIITESGAKIGLDELAGDLGYSSAYCSRYIKTVTGKNFSELINTVRMEKAKRLLRGSSATVAEIAYTCGYENPENFNRAFRKSCGVAPSVYREKGKRQKI